MGALPPLQVTVDSRNWSCVLDLRLAIARNGPMLALRLAEELRVCLVPRLLYVLDNSDHYERHPESLGIDPLGEGAFPPDREAVQQWELARLDVGLQSLRLYWTGDALHESFMPHNVDSNVVGRFERFLEGLEQRLALAAPDLESGHPLLGGAMDALALSVALGRHRPLIFTAPGSRGEAPALCRLLELCGIGCRRLEPSESRPLRRQLMPSLARSGALELCWAGLNLAVVHLVAPRALLLRPAAVNGPALDLLDGPPDGCLDVWEDASAFWYPLP